MTEPYRISFVTDGAFGALSRCVSLKAKLMFFNLQNIQNKILPSICRKFDENAMVTIENLEIYIVRLETSIIRIIKFLRIGLKNCI